jgi:hypothetical protein
LLFRLRGVGLIDSFNLNVHKWDAVRFEQLLIARLAASLIPYFGLRSDQRKPRAAGSIHLTSTSGWVWVYIIPVVSKYALRHLHRARRNGNQQI